MRRKYEKNMRKRRENVKKLGKIEENGARNLRFAFNERSGGVRDAATSNWDMSGHLANMIWRRIGP